MALESKSEHRHPESGIHSGGCEHIGQALAKTAALVVLFIFFCGSSTAQPQAKIKPSLQTVPLNRNVRVTLELSWTGEADVYDVPQPDASALSEFRIVERSVSAERKDGKNVLSHSLVMQPMKTGEYDMARINVQYYEKNKDEPTSILLPPTPITVVPRKLIPRAVIGGIVAALLAGAGGLAVFSTARRRKRLQQEQTDAAQAAGRRREKLLEELNSALSLKIEGNTGAYLERLLSLTETKELRPRIQNREELHEMTEGVKFGRLSPSPDQLRWAEKLVKNAIADAFPVYDEQAER